MDGKIFERKEYKLAINGRYTAAFRVHTGIPKVLSYRLYSTSSTTQTYWIYVKGQARRLTNSIFIDDVNILTYSTSTEENCKTLETIHRRSEAWAARHEAAFAPAKYQLIHLSKNSKKFNMQATVNIVNNIVNSKIDIRVLGVQIDTALKWGPHIKKIQEKMTKPTLAFIKISVSIWGAIFLKACQVYSAVVRPGITYESAIWHIPAELKGLKAIKRNRPSFKINAFVQSRGIPDNPYTDAWGGNLDPPDSNTAEPPAKKRQIPHEVELTLYKKNMQFDSRETERRTQKTKGRNKSPPNTAMEKADGRTRRTDQSG